MRSAASFCQQLEPHSLEYFYCTVKIEHESAAGKLLISGCSFCHASANDENQRHCDHDGGRNVARACVNSGRNGRRQCRIKHAFDAETKTCDISSQWIDDGGNT